MKFIVYKTTNLVNEKFYIGVHKKNGRKYFGSGKLIKQAIKKYGKDNFIIETLQEFDNEQDALVCEKKFVDKEMLKNPLCYNLVEGGGYPPTGAGEKNNFFGKKHTEETKKKLSKSRTGKYIGADHWNFGNNILVDKEELCIFYINQEKL